jgi:hypothetical protein
MLTITLPPELEEVVSRKAREQGTTPELLAIDALRGAFPRSEKLTSVNCRDRWPTIYRLSDGSTLDLVR